MVHIAWALLNIALLAGWLVIGWYALKLLKQRFGIAIALVFGLGTCSLVNRSSPNAQQPRYRHLEFAGNQASTSILETSGLWSVPPPDSKKFQYLQSEEVAIYSSALTTLRLVVGFGKDTASETTVPVYAYTTVDGLTAGVDWEAETPVIKSSAAGEVVEYIISGTFTWKLLGGIEVINQTEKFKGTIRL